jgi:DNA-binding MarR family transcriptional regulator
MPPSADVDTVTDALLEASKALVGIALHTLPADPGVTLTQFRAMAMMDSEPDMRAADLAEALAVSPSTATRLCDRLVRAGLVSRVASEADRREVRLSLTRAGITLVREGLAKRRKVLGRLVDQISSGDRAAFVRGLRVFEGAGLSEKEPAWAEGWRGPSSPS